MANDPGGVRTAPYGPWVGFENWLKGMKGKAVPTRLEVRQFPGMSGSGRSQLRGALRFLGVARGDQDEVDYDLFTRLVHAVGTDHWKPLLAELVPASYAHIVGGLDLTNGAEGELSEAFDKRGGVDGSSNIKARRFYLSAMQAAGIGVSPQFGHPGPKVSANGKSRATPAPRGRGAAAPATERGEVAPPPPDEGEVTPSPPGMTRIRFSLPPGDRYAEINLPPDVTANEQKFVTKYLRGYFKLQEGGASTKK